jgi:predicted DNA-binding transcriptional regulator AlpA
MQTRSFEDFPDLATRREVSQFTGIAVQTLARWASETNSGLAKGPKVTKLGGVVRYHKRDVAMWIGLDTRPPMSGKNS